MTSELLRLRNGLFKLIFCTILCLLCLYCSICFVIMLVCGVVSSCGREVVYWGGSGRCADQCSEFRDGERV